MIKLPLLVSPTRIKAWHACPRQWQYEQVYGLQAERSYLKLGTAAHAVAAHLLTDRRLPPPDPDELTDKQVLKAWEIGQQFEVLARDAVDEILSVESRQDCGWFAPKLDCLGLWRGELVVVDHKTTSEIKTPAGEPNVMRYKTEDELRDDIQCQMYCWAALQQHSEQGHVHARWHWVAKTGKHAPVVTAVTFSRAELDALVLTWQRDAEGMRRDYEQDKLLRARWQDKPLPEQCDAYGGCGVFAKCQTTRPWESWVERFRAEDVRSSCEASGT